MGYVDVTGDFRLWGFCPGGRDFCPGGFRPGRLLSGHQYNIYNMENSVRRWEILGSLGTPRGVR